MLTPGLADLHKHVGAIGVAAHSVKILRNKRMVIARQGKPIHVYRAFVAGISSQSETHAAPDGTSLGSLQAEQLPDDDVRAVDSPDARLVQCWQSRGFHIAVRIELCYLDGLH